MSRRYAAVAAVLGFSLLGAACSSDANGPGSGSLIRTQLIRLPGAGQAAASQSAVAHGLASATEEPFAWSSDLTITSFESPIRAIWLEGEGEAFSMVYECLADSNDGCLVDLAGPALQDLLAATPVTAQAGTYTEVVVSTCEEEGGYVSYLTGSVTLEGRTYVTQVDGVLDTTGTAEAVPIEYSGCARSYPIPDPLVIADTLGEDISFKLYFDIRDLAWASLGGSDTQNGWIPGGCTGPMPAGGDESPYLCTGYPDVAGVVDELTPTLERYRVNGGATIGLLFRSGTDQFIGGFTRRYFSHGLAAEPGFNADTPVEEFVDNTDGTYRLATFGGGSEGGPPVGHYLVMDSFRRDDHSGMAVDFGGQEFQYEVTRIQ